MKGQRTSNGQKVDAQSAAALIQTSHEFPSCTLPSCLKEKKKTNIPNGSRSNSSVFTYRLHMCCNSNTLPRPNWLWRITQPSSSCSCSTSGKRRRLGIMQWSTSRIIQAASRQHRLCPNITKWFHDPRRFLKSRSHIP